MFILLALSLGIPAAWAAPAPQSATSVSLDGAFRAALSRSETLASQERSTGIAEERYTQARSNILPNLSFNASYTIQDAPADPLAAAFFPRYQPEAKFTLRQPVFRGLREFAALRQYQKLERAERHAKVHATRLLYSDVSKSYHAVLATEESLRNTQEQLKLYDDRINELQRRVREGTSSQTDLLSLQSSRASVQAQFESARAAVDAAREAFSFLTAFPNDVVIAPLSGEQPRPRPMKDYLSSMDQRPDILDLQERTQSYADQVAVAKGEHLPEVDILGNYYLRRQSDVYRGIDWDVQVALSLPLFSGGGVSARVRESALQRERADLELTRVRRLSQQQIRTLHSEYQSGLQSIAALEKSLDLAEKSYQLLQRDFRRGLTRNLDVLQALIATHEVRRELLRARFQARDKWVDLNTAAGVDLTRTASASQGER